MPVNRETMASAPRTPAMRRDAMAPLLRPEFAHQLLELALSVAHADETELTLQAGSSALTRFANNGIHQNVAETQTTVSIRSVVEGRMARVSTNRLDPASIAETVARAEELARLQAPEPDLLPMPDPQQYPQVARAFASAMLTPEERAEKTEAMIAVARREKLTAAGVVANHRTAQALINSRGLEAYYEETGAEYSVTMQGSDSSGWAKASSTDGARLDFAGGAETAARKARLSAAPIELPPGRYTVILEPAAVLDLLGFLFWDFGGLAILDQRSFLTGRLGTRLFGENIHIHDDVLHPLQSGAPFDGEGMPRQRLKLVEGGVIRSLAYARQTAERMRREHPEIPAAPTGHGFPLPNEYGEAPLNIMMEGGEQTLEELIAGVERGILVTRLWYIREVDAYEKLLTGMTRDGTFLIEKGQLARGLRNFRFNQSMIELLNQVEALGIPTRASGEESFDMVVPPLRAGGFNFTEVTRF